MALRRLARLVRSVGHGGCLPLGAAPPQAAAPAACWMGGRATMRQPASHAQLDAPCFSSSNNNNIRSDESSCEYGGSSSCSASNNGDGGGGIEDRVMILPMPKLSHAMTHGRIAAWHVPAGSGGRVAEYDVLATVETESLVEEAYRLDQFAGKVFLLVESQEEGFVARLLAAEGQEVPVGRPIALLCERAEDVADVARGDGPVAAWIAGVHDVYDSSSTIGGRKLRVLEWQSYLAQGPPSSGCL